MFGINLRNCFNRLAKPLFQHKNLHLGLLRLQGKITKARHDDFVEISWENGTTTLFPFLYLREKCPCPFCYHKSSSQRILHMKNLDLNSRPVTTSVKENGDAVEIVWNDDHVSEFDSVWLHQKILPQSHSETDSKTEKSLIREGALIWDKDFRIPTFDFEPMLRNEDVLLEWLEMMRKVGVAKVQGVPRELGQLERFGSTVGFLKNTLYG